MSRRSLWVLAAAIALLAAGGFWVAGRSLGPDEEAPDPEDEGAELAFETGAIEGHGDHAHGHEREVPPDAGPASAAGPRDPEELEPMPVHPPLDVEAMRAMDEARQMTPEVIRQRRERARELVENHIERLDRDIERAREGGDDERARVLGLRRERLRARVAQIQHEIDVGAPAQPAVGDDALREGGSGPVVSEPPEDWPVEEPER